jgi:excisionase family DNA binding protein
MGTRPGELPSRRPYVTTTEVAAALGVERQTVARWIRTGKLRAIRIRVGQRSIYRIEVAEVRAFARRYIEQL